MSKKINEYTKKPNYNTMTPEEQHQWYLIAKRDLSWFKSTGDATELEQAIIDYEQRHGIR